MSGEFFSGERKSGVFCSIIGLNKCMLWRQTVHLMSRIAKLAKIPAREDDSKIARQRTRQPVSGFYLESAAFLFHMNATTQGIAPAAIVGSPQAACSEPLPTASGLPLS
jgi:hypothetical protein